jgi:hypothetical protein
VSVWGHIDSNGEDQAGLRREVENFSAFYRFRINFLRFKKVDGNQLGVFDVLVLMTYGRRLSAYHTFLTISMIGLYFCW